MHWPYKLPLKILKRSTYKYLIASRKYSHNSGYKLKPIQTSEFLLVYYAPYLVLKSKHERKYTTALVPLASDRLGQSTLTHSLLRHKLRIFML
jgi:hypothetical protein